MSALVHHQVLGPDLPNFTREMAEYVEQQEHVACLLAEIEDILMSASLLAPVQATFRCVCVRACLCACVCVCMHDVFRQYWKKEKLATLKFGPELWHPLLSTVQEQTLAPFNQAKACR